MKALDILNTTPRTQKEKPVTKSGIDSSFEIVMDVPKPQPVQPVIRESRNERDGQAFPRSMMKKLAPEVAQTTGKKAVPNLEPSNSKPSMYMTNAFSGTSKPQVPKEEVFNSLGKNEMFENCGQASVMLKKMWIKPASNGVTLLRHNMLQLAASNKITPELRLFVWLYLSESQSKLHELFPVVEDQSHEKTEELLIPKVNPKAERPKAIAGLISKLKRFKENFSVLSKSIVASKEAAEDSWAIFLKCLISTIPKHSVEIHDPFSEEILDMRYLIVPICKHVDESIASIEKRLQESDIPKAEKELLIIYEKSIKPFAQNYEDEKTRPKFFRRAISYILVKGALDSLQYKEFFTKQKRFIEDIMQLELNHHRETYLLLFQVSTCRND